MVTKSFDFRGIDDDGKVTTDQAQVVDILEAESEAQTMMSARLIDRGWLRRVVEISLPDGLHYLEYDGRGMGYEQISVDGLVIRKRSLVWFVPRFDFKLGGWSGIVEVRAWPWFTLRCLVVRLGDKIVYAEGMKIPSVKPLESGIWNELA